MACVEVDEQILVRLKLDFLSLFSCLLARWLVGFAIIDAIFIHTALTLADVRLRLSGENSEVDAIYPHKFANN